MTGKEWGSTKLGFTLIELLVVIAIIGLLGSIVLASLNSSRAKSRDARRRQDLRQVQTALELYAGSNSGGYPTTQGAWRGTCSAFGSYDTSGANGWVPNNVAPDYISQLPVDPRPMSNSCYLYRSDGVDYKILAYGTVETGVSANDTMRDLSGRPNTYAVYTSGATMW